MPAQEKPFLFGIGRTVFFAGLVSLFMDFSSEMVYPLVPLFLTTVLGTTKTAVGVIEGIAEGTASILKVFSGWLSDRVGKRKLLMGAGYGVSAMSRPVIANAGVWLEVLSARFVDRVGKGIRSAPRDALISDVTEREKLGRAFGFHRSMDTVGAVIGPAVAFVLLSLFAGDLRLVFWASTVPAVIAVLVIIFFIKERPHERVVRELPPLSIKSFGPPFRRYIAVIAIFSLATFSDAFLILKAQNVGMEGQIIVLAYLLFNMVYAATATPLGILADRVGLKNMVSAGIVYYAIILLGFALSSSPLHIWILFPLYGVYKGISDGTQRAYVAHLSPVERKGTAFGVYHTVAGVMLLPASVLAGFLWDTYSPTATFLFGSALAFLAFVYFVAGDRR